MYEPDQTSKEDLNSKLGMDLKRAMLLRLARRETELYPQDPVKRAKIYSKYKVWVCGCVGGWVGPLHTNGYWSEETQPRGWGDTLPFNPSPTWR